MGTLGKLVLFPCLLLYLSFLPVTQGETCCQYFQGEGAALLDGYIKPRRVCHETAAALMAFYLPELTPVNQHIGIPLLSGEAVSHHIQALKEEPMVYQCIYEQGSGHSFVIEVDFPNKVKTLTSYMSWDGAFSFGEWVNDGTPKNKLAVNYEHAPLGGCRSVTGDKIKLYCDMIKALSLAPAAYEQLYKDRQIDVAWKEFIPPGYVSKRDPTFPEYASVHEATLWQKLPPSVHGATVPSGAGPLQCRAYSFSGTCKAPPKKLEAIYGSQLLWNYSLFKEKNPAWVGPREKDYHGALYDKIANLENVDTVKQSELLNSLQPYLETEFSKAVLFPTSLDDQKKFWDGIRSGYKLLKPAKTTKLLEGLKMNPTRRHRQNGTDY